MHPLRISHHVCRPSVLLSQPGIIVLACSILVALATATALADPVVDHVQGVDHVQVVDHVQAADATPAFKFPHVPVPSANDAATGRKFVTVDGQPDDNSAGVEALTDGHLPGSEDAPQDNFFFAEGTDGGLLRLDFDAPINITQVNTYSWHTGTRAPQVYKLYARDESAQHFEASPAHGVDPVSCGWKLIASVNTRPTTGDEGGQYGVEIGDAKKVLAHTSSLLFHMSQTEADDTYGNTFYSEIDVISDKEMLKPATTTSPATKFSFGPSSEYHVAIDTHFAPQLESWANALEPIIAKWYPIVVASLPSDGFTAPHHFSILFNNKPGVAYTTGTLIFCASDWFAKHVNDQGAVVHEMVHVVQQYRDPQNPSWLVEGIADYFRWFKYEPASKRPHPHLASAHYSDSYQTTAAFLNYVVEHADSKLVMKMNAAMRSGTYSAALWKNYTGKTVDELWSDYVKAAAN